MKEGECVCVVVVVVDSTALMSETMKINASVFVSSVNINMV